MTITAEQARALLQAASPNWRKFDTAILVGLPGSYDPVEESLLYGGFDLRGAPNAKANADLAVAAPDLARTVIAQAEEIARLRAEEQARIAAAEAWLKENGHG